MGYPMALNLRKKIGSDYKVLICDVVQDAFQKFEEEAAGTGPNGVVKTGYEAVQAAVHKILFYLTFLESESDHDYILGLSNHDVTGFTSRARSVSG